MNKHTQILKIFVGTFVSVFATLTSPFAQSGGSEFLPDFINNLIGGENPLNEFEVRVRAAFVIAIGIIIVVAIAMGIYMVYKYVRSGGDEGEIEGSTKGIKAIFFGLGWLFVIMLGIAIVIIFFGSRIDDLFPHKICIDSPDGVGCYACQNRNLTDSSTVTPNINICSTCDKNPNGTITGVVFENTLCTVNDKTGELEVEIQSTGTYKCDQQVTEVIGACV